MRLPLFTLGRAAFGLYDAGRKTGVVGWPDVIQALAKIAPKMLAKATKVDHGALEDMEAQARAEVAVDTGNLLNGITGEETDDYFEFRASAVHEKAGGKAGADYARFVEFGHMTRGGAPAVADDKFFSEGRAPPARKPAHFVAPQPFFYDSARAALEKRGVEMSDVVEQVKNEDGWS